MRFKDIHLIQFLPYFPPHKGGLEDVAEWISSEYQTAGYGNVLNVTFSVGQLQSHGSYNTNGARVIVLPAFDLVKNFPVPKIWSPEFWQALREIREFGGDIVQTHTRFFLSSFLGGIYAKLRRKKWVHIEHGSGYVVSDQKLVTFFSRFFDRTIGSWILRHADHVIAISEACKAFVHKEFVNREVTVIYRGMSLPEVPRIPSTDGKIHITFVGRLVYLKGVSYLLEAIERLVSEGVTDFSCRIVGDGEMRTELENTVQENSLGAYVEFLGFRSKEEILSSILPSTDIFVNPSLQEGLPTTVVEALLSRCAVVATDVGGTREICNGEDLKIIAPGDVDVLAEGLRSMFSIYRETSGTSYNVVKEKFDARGNIGRMYEVFKNIVGKQNKDF